MKRPYSSFRLLAAASVFIALAAFHLSTFKTFPMVDMDEAMESNHAYNVLTRSENVYGLYEDVFPRPFAFMEHALPNTLRPFFNMGLAAAFRVGGVSPWSGRAFSLLCGAASLALVTALAWRWTASPAAALGAALLLGFNAPFSFSAHEIRPEAMLGLFSCLTFFFFDWAETRPWLLTLAGFFAACAPGIHTNGWAVAAAAGCLWLVRAPRAGPWFFLGATAGASLVLSFIHPERFLPSWVVFQGFFSYSPPVKVFGWNVGGMIAQELKRYLGAPFLGYIPIDAPLGWALKLHWSIAAGLCLFAARFFSRDARTRALLIWILAQALFYTLFVTNKNPNYASVIEPFLALLCATVLHRVWKENHAPGAPWPLVAFGALCAWIVLIPGAYLLAGLFAPIALAGEKRGAALFFLAALAPLFCLRVFAPDVFTALSRGAFAPENAAALLGAAGLAAAMFPAAWPRRQLAAAWAATALALALGAEAAVQGAWMRRYARGTVDFDQVARRAREIIPPGARVLGPQLLWFAFEPDPYRDFDALSYARWLTARTDVTEHLAAWKPDYLIVDCRFRDIFLKRSRLDQVLKVPLSKIGEIDEGRRYCHPLEFYRFDWNAKASRSRRSSK